MKKIILSLLTILTASFVAAPVLASDVMVAATMQRCTSNEECTLVSNSCADNCGFVPVNKSNIPALEGLYQTRCGKPVSANPQCNMNPPIAAACINSRCTIDYAYAHHAGAKDYKPGAYPVPEAPVTDKVKGDYSKINDKKGGFTAYDLPQTEIKQDAVGTIVDKVYVPPSAPVNGGNYVPVTPSAAPVPAQQPAPAAVPPAAVPQNTTYATPPTPAPVPAQQVPTAPNAGYVPSAPAPAAIQPANVPQMTPSRPYAPQAAIPAPAPAYVPPAPTAEAPLPAPIPNAPYQYVPSADAGPQPAPAPVVMGVPQAPPGSVPIPPSDLKPSPTFVPPPGGTIPVGPNDPGATPPGATLILPVPHKDDPESVKKSFAAAQTAVSTRRAPTTTND